MAGEIGFKIILQFVASVVTRPRPAFGGTATRDENRRWALPVDVLRATAFRTLLFVGAGIASGLVGAIAAAVLLRSVFFGVSPWDARTLASSAAVVATCATLAAVWPAARAARLDPNASLRQSG